MKNELINIRKVYKSRFAGICMESQYMTETTDEKGNVTFSGRSKAGLVGQVFQVLKIRQLADAENLFWEGDTFSNDENSVRLEVRPHYRLGFKPLPAPGFPGIDLKVTADASDYEAASRMAQSLNNIIERSYRRRWIGDF